LFEILVSVYSRTVYDPEVKMVDLHHWSGSKWYT